MTSPCETACQDSQESFALWQKRMLFACKRGNIETELLFDAFIRQQPSCAIEKRQLIENLLNESEQDLFHWLIRPIHLPSRASQSKFPPRYSGLIAEIQQVYLINR